MPSSSRLPAVFLGATVLVALLLLSGTPGEARGGSAPGRPPAGPPPSGNPQPAPADPNPSPNPNHVLGAKLFEQCVRWVAAGGQGQARTDDFYIGVTAELDLETTRHRGPMRLWWKAPDKYRQAMTTGGQTTTKILNNEFMWIVHPNGHVQRMHGTPDGVKAVAQLKDDRERMADLAQFITLRSLSGPGVVFDFVGEKTGSGSYRGNWVKITRRAPGATLMHMWLAYEKDARGDYVAQWPGIVRIEGDARKGIPTEDFILKSWAESAPGEKRPFRYPREIEAFSLQPGQPAVRFLRATVNTIRINAGIPDAMFNPPRRR